jgi:hypothetical protein
VKSAIALTITCSQNSSFSRAPSWPKLPKKYIFIALRSVLLDYPMDLNPHETGAFLRAGLVDELNLILCPAVDGAKGAPSVFDSTDAEADRRARVTTMTLESSHALEGGAMLLRYRIQNADIQTATDR